MHRERGDIFRVFYTTVNTLFAPWDPDGVIGQMICDLLLYPTLGGQQPAVGPSTAQTCPQGPTVSLLGWRWSAVLRDENAKLSARTYIQTHTHTPPDLN